jgi:hypothetical protein
MGESDTPKMQVTQYFASIHFGICHGPLDYISRILVQDKEAWAGQQDEQGEIYIDRDDLFGGTKKEGGVSGLVEYLPGGPAQTIPANLATKAGRTTATMPAYRGIASAWFYEHDRLDSEWGVSGGFYWSANSPYLPGVWIEAARASTALNEGHARIYRGETSSGFTSRDLSLATNKRSFDIVGDTIAYASGGTLTIEEAVSGTEIESVSISYNPVWVSISASREQVLVLDEDYVLHVYNATTGSLVETVSGWNGSVDDAVDSMLPPSEIVIDDVTYLVFWSNQTIFAFSNDGSGWEYLWQDTGFGVGGTVGETITIGPTYIYTRQLSGVVKRWPWTPAGVSSSTTIDMGSLGWTQTINSVTYDAANNQVIVLGRNGHFMVTNEAMSVVVLHEILGSWAGDAGNTFAYPVRSSRLLGDTQTDVIAFWESGNVFVMNSETGAVIASYPDSEWDFDASAVSYEDGAYSETAGALVLNTNEFTKVLFFPQAVFVPFDSNPAHIIYESLINTEWGMGASTSAIDFDSFTDAGATLYDEDFGLSMIWTQQTTIEAFVSEVLDHIEATLFVSPRTGLLTLKLIRDDYSITGLPEFTPDNSVVTKFSRKLWGETINEIVVTFTNPENEEEETVVAQDLANISTQGGIVSDSRNYYGVRVKDLAMRLAQRDLRSAATPLASCDIEVNREGWDLLPGDVCILNSPEDGIESVVMRVGPVDYGRPGDATVKASLVEDVWALAIADYTVPPDTEAVDTSEEPSTADFTLILTLPYFFVVRRIDPAILADVEYPEVFAGVLAAEDGTDTIEFDLYGEVTDAGGNVTVEDLGTKLIASRATLPDAIDAETETIIVSLPDITQGNGPSLGGFMLIEGDDETEHEFCLVTAAGGSPSSFTFSRGVLDTVPRAWPAGTPVWFIDSSLVFADATIRSDAETVDYQILPRTSLGTLALADAPTVSETLTARPHLPFRPANVTVNGDNGFSGAVDCVGVDPIPVTWARRNRLTEDAIVLAWNAADVTPEAGQTTTVTLTDLAGNTLHAYTAIAGTSQDVDPNDFGGETHGYIVVSAARDGLESLQGFAVEVIVSGYAMLLETGDNLLLETGDILLLE